MEVVHGRIEEKTCCSRMRRAMSWVYWPPKSRTTTPPRSELGLVCSGCIWVLLDIVPPVAIERQKKQDARESPVLAILQRGVELPHSHTMQRQGSPVCQGRRFALPRACH